jgi:hypothetical protein
MVTGGAPGVMVVPEMTTGAGGAAGFAGALVDGLTTGIEEA